MKNPTNYPSLFSPVFRQEVSQKVSNKANFDAQEIDQPEMFGSDLHHDDGAMMTEIYGSEFQNVWKKTRKKWWA